MIYATGANDRWQCSEIQDALGNMDLVEDEYLDSSKFTEKDLAERGGPVIPDEAAAIVKNV